MKTALIVAGAVVATAIILIIAARKSTKARQLIAGV